MGERTVLQAALGLVVLVVACALCARGGGAGVPAPAPARAALEERAERGALLELGRSEPAREALAVVAETTRASAERAAAHAPSPAGVELVGTALDERGAPLAALALELAPESARAGGAPREARTDRDGRFVFEGLAPGRWRLAALDARVLPGALALEVPDGVRALERTLVLARGRALEGRVVDGDGRPLAGASVTPWRSDERGARLDRRCAAETGPDGRFALAGDGLGATRVVVESAGFRAWSGALTADAPAEIALERAPPLRGSVRLAGGAPAAGSRVRARAGEVEASALVGARGEFALEGVPLGSVRIAVEGRHGALAPLAVEHAEGGAPLALVLPAGRELRARVLDPEGAPLAGVRVVALAPGERRALGAARSGADGRARLVGLPEGALELTAEHERWLFPRRAPDDAGEVVLRGEAGAFLALALDADARWLARLGRSDGAEPERTLFLDPEAALALGPLASGSWEVRLVGPLAEQGQSRLVAAPEDGLVGARRQVLLAAGARERVELAAPRVARIEGRVAAPAPHELLVELLDPAGETLLDRAPVDAAGRFRIEALPPGGYRLGLVAPGGGTWLDPAPLALEAGAAPERLLTPPEAACALEVVASDGRPVPGASARLASAVPSAVHGALRDPRGVRILDYGPGAAGADERGRIVLRLWPEGSRTVLLRAPGFRELLLEVPPAASKLTATLIEGENP